MIPLAKLLQEKIHPSRQRLLFILGPLVVESCSFHLNVKDFVLHKILVILVVLSLQVLSALPPAL